ncbi:MAG: sigma-70 family RNA polymerase sigma factor [Candidatus Saccharibacteria bacterium]
MNYDFRSPQTDLETIVQEYVYNPSDDVMHEVVEAAKGLIYHFAHLYSPTRPCEDLVQAGYEGLLKALKRFDPTRKVQFVTFATHYITGEMRHYLRSETSYHRPRALAELQEKIFEVSEVLTKTLDRPPSLDEVADEVNVTKEGIIQALKVGRVSMEEINVSAIKSVRYESFKLPIEDRIALTQAFDTLNEVQRRVIYLIFFKDMTQAEAGAELGIGQRQVSRHLKRGLDLMARHIG